MIDCVEELHNHGIFHNDLKLDQFFIDRDYMIKLGDFNSITTNELTYDYLDADVEFLPTESLRPPETVDNKNAGKPRNCRTDDIYMLGKAIYSLVRSTNERFNEEAISLAKSLIHDNYDQRVKTIDEIKQSE